MGKIHKKKSRIKLNEVLNNRLDAMEDTSSLEVFAPKKDANLDFMNLVNEAIEEEGTGKKGLKSKGGNSVGMTIAVGLIFILFFFFVYLMWTMIF